MNRALPTGFVSLLLACTGVGGQRPQDMSAAEYERWAEREERAADAYESAEAQAAGPHASQQDYAAALEYRRRAIDHRELAAEQRAVSRELRAVEERACTGIPADDPDPFARRDRITSVSVLEERSLSAPAVVKVAGVSIVLRGEPGMTAKSLQQTLDCHLARARLLDHDRGRTGDTPLTLEDVHACVASTSDGLVVRLTSEDPDAVRDIIRWTEGLAH